MAVPRTSAGGEASASSERNGTVLSGGLPRLERLVEHDPRNPRRLIGVVRVERDVAVLAVGPRGMVGADGLKNSAQAAATKNSLDATLPESWIEIHPDNTILIRTGKSDFGQSTTFTAYRQIVAEELSDGMDIGALHAQPTGSCVPEIMEVEVCDLQSAAQATQGNADPFRLKPGEQQVQGFCLLRHWQGFDRLDRQAIEDDSTVSVLRLREQDSPPVQVHIQPAQPQNF